MRNQYVANGSCSNFPFTFPTESAADIEVLVNDVATGCTVSGAGSPLGGGVVLVSPPSAGSVVVVRHRGEVTVSDTDARSGHLADKLMAGANATLTVQTAADGFQTVVVSGPDTADFLRKSQNLAELADAAQARANLGLGTAATTDVGTEAGDVVMLDASARLPAVDGSQLTNIPFGKVKASSADTIADFLDTKLVAGANVTITEVAGTSDKALAIAAATDPGVTAQLQALSDQLATVIWNQGLLVLRSQIGAGWSVLKFVDGVADEFEDESGVDAAASANEVYSAAGGFYSNGDADTLLLLHCDGTSGAALFADSSPWARTCTPGGSAQISTAQAKFGSTACALNGNSDHLSVAASADWKFGDFTVEGFGYFRTLHPFAINPTPFVCLYADSGNRIFWHVASDGIQFTVISAGNAIASTGWVPVTIATDAWHHLVWQRSGASFCIYVDGVRVHNATLDFTFPGWADSIPLSIGDPGTGYYRIDGYVDEVRISNVARYNGATIPVPSAPFGAVMDATLVSEVFPAAAAPAEARLVLLHQPVDATTLNTDVTVEVSRDGGTTWTAGTLADEGAFDATTRILSAVIDLSAQPAGTAMRWRFRTFNQKSQRLHGVWMQWR